MDEDKAEQFQERRQFIAALDPIIGEVLRAFARAHGLHEESAKLSGGDIGFWNFLGTIEHRRIWYLLRLIYRPDAPIKREDVLLRLSFQPDRRDQARSHAEIRALVAEIERATGITTITTFREREWPDS